MRLCNESQPVDIVEYLAKIVAFLGEASTGSREVEFSEAALCGMFMIFSALEADLETLRLMLIQPPARSPQGKD